MSRYSRRMDLQASLSLLLALVLTATPFPESLAPYRPAFVLAVTGYWLLMLPRYYGLLVAWAMGLALDALGPGLLGQHALAMTVSCYVLLRLSRSMAMAPMFGQIFLWLPVVGLYEFVLFWMDGVSGRSADPWYRWLPVITTPLLWPLLNLLFAALSSRRD